MPRSPIAAIAVRVLQSGEMAAGCTRSGGMGAAMTVGGGGPYVARAGAAEVRKLLRLQQPLSRGADQGGHVQCQLP